MLDEAFQFLASQQQVNDGTPTLTSIMTKIKQQEGILLQKDAKNCIERR
jgi:hypothetical protein